MVDKLSKNNKLSKNKKNDIYCRFVVHASRLAAKSIRLIGKSVKG